VQKLLWAKPLIQGPKCHRFFASEFFHSLLKAQCTRAKAGRTLKRHEHQEQLECARDQSHGEEAREDRKRRQWFQERNFGEAAVMHGFKKARWRGIEKQSIQDLLIATIQNLKILARKDLWVFFCIRTSSLRR